MICCSKEKLEQKLELEVALGSWGTLFNDEALHARCKRDAPKRFLGNVLVNMFLKTFSGMENVT